MREDGGVTFDELRANEARFHMPVYGRQPVAFVRGEGMHLWDADGNRYLDFVAGIAVVGVGHSHPNVVAAVRGQAGKLTHVSNLYYTEPQVRLAGKLHELLGWGKVFFANSGAEANECALKLARRWQRDQGRPGRSGVVAASGSFHGRTVATLAATGQPHKHEPFAPLPAELIHHVPLNDIAALESALEDDGIGAVLLEVVQGEGGINIATAEYLAAARKLCDENDSLLIFDEVQTGLGRTGRWFGFEHAGVVPDVVTLAKALGGGLPIGACIAREDVADAFKPGDHATTFGGGPIPCAAALAVLDVIESEKLVENSAAMGERLVALLHDALDGNPAVVEIRGLGLLVGVQLAGEWARDVVDECRERGLLVNNVQPDTVRLSPPLIVSETDLAGAVEILAAVLDGFRGKA
jgi:predicted acetylornithine/succinylornithine family transaminase